MSSPPAPTAFFKPDGDTYVASELTRGPWDPDSQHAGPPAALLAREVERVASAEPRHVGRITYEILRPVPIAPLRASARVIRPGQRVELVEAALADDHGDVIRALAWRLRIGDLRLGGELGDGGGAGQGATLRREQVPPGPGEGREVDFFDTGHAVGYHTAMDYRFVAGEFTRVGPATCWLRMRHPLLAGEEPSPLQRVAVAADTGNGISAALDFSRFVFINVDLTIHLSRPPVGEWVCLDSVTLAEPSGIGLTDTALLDERGPIGRAAQTLVVAERGG